MDAGREHNGEQQELLLTFAELEALVAGGPRWPNIRAAMNTRPPADEQVAIAGAASLFVRNMARFSEDGRTEVTGPVGILVKPLGTATHVIGVTLAEQDGSVAPFLLCAGDDGRTLVRVAGPGVLALSPVVDDTEIPEQVALLTGALLDDHEGAVLIKPQNEEALTVRRLGQQWEVADPVPEGVADFRPVSREDALDAVKTCVRNAERP